MVSITLTFYSYIISSFVLYVSFYEFIQYFTHHRVNSDQQVLLTYDYIVVGSGPGGSTVALRLAESGKYSVLLLEAGVYGNFLYDIPLMAPVLHTSSVDWQYYTEPQEYSSFALNEKKTHLTTGRIFGGSARLNNMLYVRGHRKDFNVWYMDKTDYDYKEDVLKYFKKSENQMGIYGGDIHHGIDGPMNVEDLQYTTPLADAILEAAKFLGYPVQDINSQLYSGFMKPQVTMKNGKRWTIADTLLQNKPKNLHILTGAHVLTLLFKGYHEVYGVSFHHFSQLTTAIAKKSIILSAGAINTPKILMLSGIGPAEHLNNLGIDVRVNLPVGKNLQDHILTGLDLVTLNETLPVNLNSMMSILSGFKYFYYGKGPWTVSPCEVIGIPESYSFNKSPKLELMVLPLGISSDEGLSFYKSLNIKECVWNQYFKPLIGKQVISILPTLLHPKSTGEVRLRSTDFFDPPIINPNYLSDEEDVQVLVEGIDIIKKIINTPPMQKLGAKLNDNIFPGCERFKFDSKDYWKCYVRQLTMTTYHPGGTCKMGHENDKTAVVDFNFKVKGIDNLYIADASVMPTMTSGNIQAVVAMIGERLADILLHKVDTHICHSREYNRFFDISTCDVSL